MSRSENCVMQNWYGQSGKYLIAYTEEFTSLIGYSLVVAFVFFFFCININLERAGFLSHIVTFEMPKYLKGLIFTQVQCCFLWEHSCSTFNLKTRVSASVICTKTYTLSTRSCNQLWCMWPNTDSPFVSVPKMFFWRFMTRCIAKGSKLLDN